LIVLVAGAARAALSVSGVIDFGGIIVPHLLRLFIGPGQRLLLPASAGSGAILLLAADTPAWTVAAPAELPIGICYYNHFPDQREPSIIGATENRRNRNCSTGSAELNRGSSTAPFFADWRERTSMRF
jgi:FecCD transport family